MNSFGQMICCGDGSGNGVFVWKTGLLEKKNPGKPHGSGVFEHFVVSISAC
jgi:hypothetical protein